MKKDNREIIKKIKDLKEIKPQSEWQAMTRDFLLSKINREAKLEPAKIGWQEYGWFFTRVFKQRLLEPAVVILLVLGFSVSSSLIVNAAFYSLPGDSLYRMKIALENTQLAITPSEEKKVELKIEFAQKRVDEFNKIVGQTNVNPELKKERINVAIREFQKNVVAVRQHVEKSATVDNNILLVDKEKTLRMAAAISSRTEELAKSLDEKIEGLSEVEKIEVEELVAEAVESAQAASLSAQEIIDEASPSATTTDEVISQSTSDETDQAEDTEEEQDQSATTTINIQSFGDQTDQPEPVVDQEEEEKVDSLETTPEVLDN